MNAQPFAVRFECVVSVFTPELAAKADGLRLVFDEHH